MEQRSSVRQAMEQIINNLKTLDELSQCGEDVNVLLTEGQLVTGVKNNILAMQEVQDAIEEPDTHYCDHALLRRPGV